MEVWTPDSDGTRFFGDYEIRWAKVGGDYWIPLLDVKYILDPNGSGKEIDCLLKEQAEFASRNSAVIRITANGGGKRPAKCVNVNVLAYICDRIGSNTASEFLDWCQENFGPAAEPSFFSYAVFEEKGFKLINFKGGWWVSARELGKILDEDFLVLYFSTRDDMKGCTTVAALPGSEGRKCNERMFNREGVLKICSILGTKKAALFREFWVETFPDYGEDFMKIVEFNGSQVRIVTVGGHKLIPEIDLVSALGVNRNEVFKAYSAKRDILKRYIRHVFLDKTDKYVHRCYDYEGLELICSHFDPSVARRFLALMASDMLPSGMAEEKKRFYDASHPFGVVERDENTESKPKVEPVEIESAGSLAKALAVFRSLGENDASIEGENSETVCRESSVKEKASIYQYELFPAEFNGVSVQVIKKDGFHWLSGPDICRIMGYKSKSVSVMSSYRRWKDEIDRYSTLIKIPKKSGGGGWLTRIYRYEGIRLFYSAKQWDKPPLKHFRDWCKSVLLGDKEPEEEIRKPNDNLCLKSDLHVRSLIHKGQKWVMASDLCRMLGYVNPYEVVLRMLPVLGSNCKLLKNSGTGKHFRIRVLNREGAFNLLSATKRVNDPRGLCDKLFGTETTEPVDEVDDLEPDEKEKSLIPSGKRWERFQNLEFMILDVHGKKYVTAEDLGRALDYEQPRISIINLFRRHRDDLEPHSAVIELITPGGSHFVRCFDKEGVFLIIALSHQPKARQLRAKEFQLWVFKVLGSIHDKGYYVESRHGFGEERPEIYREKNKLINKELYKTVLEYRIRWMESCYRLADLHEDKPEIKIQFLKEAYAIGFNGKGRDSFQAVFQSILKAVKKPLLRETVDGNGEIRVNGKILKPIDRKDYVKLSDFAGKVGIDPGSVGKLLKKKGLHFENDEHSLWSYIKLKKIADKKGNVYQRPASFYHPEVLEMIIEEDRRKHAAV